MQTNARLAIVVAAVSVTAVVAGSALAYRQVPKTFGSQAAPLTAPTSPTPQASKTPTGTPSAPTSAPASKTPSPTPAGTTPSPPPAGPVKVKVDLTKLSKGRDPQVPFVVGREVRGGTGWMRKLPGTDTITDIARLGDDVLAILHGYDYRLVKVGSSGKPRYTPNVSSLVGGDGGSVAYAAAPPFGTGGTVYAETAESIRKFAVPSTARELEVVRLGNDGRVYFHWKDAATGPWKLFEWVPGAATVKQLAPSASPYDVSPDGAVAISTSNSAPGETTRLCSTVTLLPAGKQLWRTCDSVLAGFTPDHSVAIGVGDRAEVGIAARITAQDTASGKVIREWTGAFERVIPEDDQHLLIVAVDKPSGATKSSIVRCAISTGNCEIAVPLVGATIGLSGE